MRVLGFVAMLVLFVTGPSLAGANDSDLPGVGTFTYNGPSVGNGPTIVMPGSTEVMTVAEERRTGSTR